MGISWMVMKMNSTKYYPTIGIECHVQLKTKTKLFSGAGNDAREAKPNTLINHIDFGLPGALPVLNKEALELASRAAMALGTRPQLFSTFDRKHYFYPDLPMGYQITQYDQPIIRGGEVAFRLNGEVKMVGITRAHLEADAGKSVHPAAKDYSLVDLNRAGTPLLEIVSEPDMHSAAEARAYSEELYLLMRYAGVTEGDLYHGNMRFDVNVSLSRDPNQLGVRSETKNLNSFRAVEKAVEYEIKRQSDIIGQGQSVVQETRGWNEAKQKTIAQRSKENADDYRYMPDPDLPPVTLSKDYVAKIEAAMPKLPDYWRAKLRSIGVSEEHVNSLIVANLDFEQAGYLNLLLAFKNDSSAIKTLSNWLVNIDIPLMRENAASANSKLERNHLYSELLKLMSEKKLSSTNAKELISRYLSLQDLPSDILKYAADAGLLQQSDEAALTALIKEVIDANPAAVKDIKAGETKAIGYLIGQVMSKSKGQANPELSRQIIMDLLQ